MELGSKLEETENQHCDQCCPNLNLSRIGAGSHKGLGLKILLQGFKEDLDLPTLLIDGGKGRGSQVQVLVRKTRTSPFSGS